MADDRQAAIPRRAYELWEDAGRTGDAEHHWLQAEQDFEAALVRSRPDEWADRLRSFYRTLPNEPAPEEHWRLVVQLAVWPAGDFTEDPVVESLDGRPREQDPPCYR